MLDGLPEPARRFFLHAIREGTPLARSVLLRQTARMKPAPERAYVDLTCSQRLTPGQGFVWWARAKMGPLPMTVTDHYFRDDGSVTVTVLGLVRVGNDTGPDVARSARGRLAAEALWCPSALLPGEGVRWEAVDERGARVIQRIDGEEVSVTIAVDAEGRVEETTMDRYGNVDRPDWGPTPYGFLVLEEVTFGGHTIPSRLRGGWWYGSDRYREADATEIVVLDAEFS